jgi:cyanophycinase
MGGGVDVDDAFTWWSPLVNGGDVVVLRTSGGDGYGNYLRSFGADSVETLRVDSRALADSDYVADRLAKAEGIFIAGGDQGDQAAAWRGTKLAGGLAAAWARGAALGGTSAGAMVLGEFVFVAGAGSLGSAAALADPFDPAVTVEGEVVALPPLRGVLVDTHFKARGRMGRLAVFLARVITSGLGPTPRGIGLDQATALVIDGAGNAEVVGDGKAYLLVPSHDPEVCSPGMPLSWTGLTVFALGPGDRLMLPDATASVPGTALSVGKDGTVPPDPY